MANSSLAQDIANAGKWCVWVDRDGSHGYVHTNEYFDTESEAKQAVGRMMAANPEYAFRVEVSPSVEQVRKWHNQRLEYDRQTISFYRVVIDGPFMTDDGVKNIIGYPISRKKFASKFGAVRHLRTIQRSIPGAYLSQMKLFDVEAGEFRTKMLNSLIR